MNAQLTLAWVGFNAFILLLLILDLGVFHRKAHEIETREAIFWSVVWLVIALAFAGLVWQYPIIVGRTDGETAALEYLTGYLIERALSVDNLFVFVLIFAYFHVPGRYQHRVLFWGILGALVMRGAMIVAGAALIHEFEWVIYVFGALLLVTALRMLTEKTDSTEPKGLGLIAALRRFMPVTDEYHGAHFFVRVSNAAGTATRFVATPLFLVLVVVEASDLVFAVDSIPAIFAVTTDPLIIYTSNVFAILGLRALYFLIAGIIPRFRLLKPALSLVLAFVGAKMLLSEVLEIPLGVSLGVVTGVLVLAILLSMMVPPPPPGGDGHVPRSGHQRGRRRAVTRRWSEPAPRDTTASKTP
jgi:tellurite resistance protein TerC